MHPQAKCTYKFVVLSLLLLAGGLAFVLMTPEVAMSSPSAGLGHAPLADSPPLAYVGRFDPSTQTFISFTLTAGSDPIGIATFSNTTNVEVWFTEPALDRVGRLVYTSPTDYKLDEAIVTVPNGYPLNIAVTNNYVWFTEYHGNKIGRLNRANPQGSLVEYTVPTANSRPADLSLTPGMETEVWFTEQGAGKIGRLTVTAAEDVLEAQVGTFKEFTHTLGFYSPYGIMAVSSNEIWFTEPVSSVVSWLNPSKGQVIKVWPAPGTEHYYPFDVVVDAKGDTWLTMLQAHGIGRIIVGTFTFAIKKNTPTPNSSPCRLDLDSQGKIWFTERDGERIGRFDPITENFNEYYIAAQASPQGLAVDNNDIVWFVYSYPFYIDLPLNMKNHTF